MSWRLTSKKGDRDHRSLPSPLPSVRKNTNTSLDDIFERQITKARQKREWRTFVFQVIATMLAVYLLLTQVIGVVIVHGDSMEPSLHNADICLIWRLSGRYVYGDTVAFESVGAGELLIKRVIAGPGDTVELLDGQVLVNNAILYEPNIYADTYAYADGPDYPLTLDENTYFCLGDNRVNSLDSRDNRVGVVSRSDIKGKIIFQMRTGK